MPIHLHISRDSFQLRSIRGFSLWDAFDGDYARSLQGNDIGPKGDVQGSHAPTTALYGAVRRVVWTYYYPQVWAI